MAKDLIRGEQADSINKILTKENHQLVEVIKLKDGQIADEREQLRRYREVVIPVWSTKETMLKADVNTAEKAGRKYKRQRNFLAGVVVVVSVVALTQSLER